MPDLTTDVRYIRGIGEQKAKALAKLDIHTLRDLISYFPRAYEDRRSIKEIRDLEDGESACVEAMVAEPPVAQQARNSRTELVKVRAVDGRDALYITFFNQPYMKNALKEGETYTFWGKAERTGKRRTMVNPLVERQGARELTGRIVPIYPLTAGITQLALSRAVAQGLSVCVDILPDPLPEKILQEHQLCHIGYAYRQIHFPSNEEELSLARRRLVFEELFLLAIGLRRLRGRRDAFTCQPFGNTNLDDFYAALPFSLTDAQRRAVDEILADLVGTRPMNRLVQGDVGSGKTMVAAAAIVCAVRNGKQAALMAPTEILAEQHHRGLAPLLEGLGISCALLTGSAKARRTILSSIESGEAQVVIGTHALISPDVVYQDLGLVVTDEQHRFGVAQRSALSAKGERPHLLVMSATPIPRTLALMIYGDLDISIIDQLPPGRQKIHTACRSSASRPKIYSFIEQEIAAGGQAYIICSMVEENDTIPDDRKAATAYAKMLQTQVFPRLRVGCIHGRMKPTEKEAVMSAFSAGEIQILVSTTVVEVGVDIPNANIMLIEDADRFGLSQLHQLRGRVGRGQRQSFCILISDNRSEETQARLKIMTQTADGFKIAEEDLRLRGPGDFFGHRQHGLPALKVADLVCDMPLLKEAQKAAEKLLEADPELKAYPATAQRVEEMFQNSGGTLN